MDKKIESVSPYEDPLPNGKISYLLHIKYTDGTGIQKDYKNHIDRDVEYNRQMALKSSQK